MLEYYPQHAYQAYQGGYISADTFEELLIKTAEDVKEKYGDFNHESFLTDAEKKNHKEQMAFTFTELDNGYHSFDNNPDYIEVRDSTINQRWIDWLKTTDYWKKHWDPDDENENAN